MGFEGYFGESPSLRNRYFLNTSRVIILFLFSDDLSEICLDDIETIFH